MNNIANNFPMEKSVPNVMLSVESLPESKVQEISLNGTETYFKTLTMSENLCKMATKIDFLNTEEDSKEEDDSEVHTSSFQTQRWPWESIRNHLQQALTEINVLTDVLTITQNKGPPKNEATMTEGGKYMMFDHARKEGTTAVKLSQQLPTKKKGLNAAADILLKGEKSLRNAGEEVVPDLGYHFHLLKLRKYWRIRKVGSKVLGDFSYRTTGSDYGQPGNFEVIKATTDDADSEETKSSMPYSFPQKPLDRVSQQPGLKVIIGADLKSSTCIRLCLKNSGESDISIDLPNLPHFDSLIIPNEPEWHKTLSNAQNTLLCRELFNKLAKEAVQLKTSATVIPFSVVGSKISTKIFPEMEFSIELIRKNLNETSHQNLPRKAIRTEGHGIFSLKLASIKLLLDQHKKMFKVPAPHPVTATFGLSKIQRKAPTTPFVLSQVQTFTETEGKSMIEHLVGMAKHWELKRRVCKVIDMLGNSIRDPYMQAHWSTVGSPMETSVCIVITSAGYEACNRTLVNMTVGTDNVKAVQKDGHAVYLSSNFHHIHDYLLSLLCSHQLNTIQELCNILGWTIQHFSLHSGIGHKTAFGSAGTLMAASRSGNSAISVRCWIERKNGRSVPDDQICYVVHEQTIHPDTLEGEFLSQSSYQYSEQSSIQNPKWSLVGAEWRQVDWIKLYGKFFISKVESLLTFSNTN
ncbi:mediator of RNA polymerase II transcription subunit 17-like [Styela clava]